MRGTWSQPKLSAIISGKRSITQEIVLDLEDALGTSPEFWLGLQMGVNLWNAYRQRKHIKRILQKKPRTRQLKKAYR